MKPARLLAAPVVAGVMVLAQAVGISPASADVNDMACNYDHITFNACLDFRSTADVNTLIGHVGLDSYMSEGYAQEIVSHGAAFRASLWGDDGGNDRWLADLAVVPGWPASGPDGLGADLSAALYRGDLNEDTDSEDEIYAKVSYFDYHTGRTKIFRTGTVHGDFAPIFGGGGPGCLVLC
jgi:hypothetical protein